MRHGSKPRVITNVLSLTGSSALRNLTGMLNRCFWSSEFVYSPVNDSFRLSIVVIAHERVGISPTSPHNYRQVPHFNANEMFNIFILLRRNRGFLLVAGNL